MFKMTKGDLARKSNAQLCALFQEASKGLSANPSDIATTQSLLAMIRIEIANRGHSHIPHDCPLCYELYPHLFD